MPLTNWRSSYTRMKLPGDTFCYPSEVKTLFACYMFIRETRATITVGKKDIRIQKLK